MEDTVEVRLNDGITAVLHKGGMYWVRFRKDGQKIDRETVMRFLDQGSEGVLLHWSLRPVAGTGTMHPDDIIEISAVSMDTPPLLPRVIRTERQ